MNILLTNDDGIYADGLRALYESFAPEHSVTVVAPDRERSAVGHGITLLNPLRARPVGNYGGNSEYAVNGTPADCVKLGLQKMVRDRPDMVISGINAGSNVGNSVNYSGTVAAAREAALCGVAAIAVSVNGFESAHYDSAAAFTEKLAQMVFRKGLPFGTLLNVNIPDIPPEDILGVRITGHEVSHLTEVFEERTDPRNLTYYWLGADTRTFGRSADTDGAALFQDYISISPLKCDMTDYSLLEEMDDWGVTRL